MKIKIDFWLQGKASYETEADDVKMALEIGVKAGVDFSYARLDGARLDGARLDGARLDRASLDGARLDGARLDGARLDGARLDGASLDRASLVGASLVGASLVGASLDGASLDGARLDGAKNLTMPTGESWEEYLTQTVPALLTAGGKALDDVANEEHWSCHDWNNCPIKAAFDVKSADDVPPLYRMHAKQFVSLFDAKQIPLDKVNPKMAKSKA
jgi:hypothetical protein